MFLRDFVSINNEQHIVSTVLIFKILLHLIGGEINSLVHIQTYVIFQKQKHIWNTFQIGCLCICKLHAVAHKKKQRDRYVSNLCIVGQSPGNNGIVLN